MGNTKAGGTARQCVIEIFYILSMHLRGRESTSLFGKVTLLISSYIKSFEWKTVKLQLKERYYRVPELTGHNGHINVTICDEDHIVSGLPYLRVESSNLHTPVFIVSLVHSGHILSESLLARTIFLESHTLVVTKRRSTFSLRLW